MFTFVRLVWDLRDGKAHVTARSLGVIRLLITHPSRHYYHSPPRQCAQPLQCCKVPFAMFRNPRENRTLPESSQLTPSAGRPPSPPRSSNEHAPMPAKTAPKTAPSKPTTTALQQKKAASQTTLVDWAKKSPANNGKNKPKPQGTPNGNIMAFFKKAEEINNRIFLQEKGTNPIVVLEDVEHDVGWSDDTTNGVMTTGNGEERYNENGGSNKKRKLSEEAAEAVAVPACSPPPPPDEESTALERLAPDVPMQMSKLRKRSGPFVDDSESEDDEAESNITRRGMIKIEPNEQSPVSKPLEEPPCLDDTERTIDRPAPFLKTESTSQFGEEEYEDFEGIEDDETLEGEEYDERRWMRNRQIRRGVDRWKCSVMSNMLWESSRSIRAGGIGACQRMFGWQAATTAQSHTQR
jgi:DNA cross-link repair 1A protein